jgi:hypothetical protein
MHAAAPRTSDATRAGVRAADNGLSGARGRGSRLAWDGAGQRAARGAAAQASQASLRLRSLATRSRRGRTTGRGTRLRRPWDLAPAMGLPVDGCRRPGIDGIGKTRAAAVGGSFRACNTPTLATAPGPEGSDPPRHGWRQRAEVSEPQVWGPAVEPGQLSRSARLTAGSAGGAQQERRGRLGAGAADGPPAAADRWTGGRTGIWCLPEPEDRTWEKGSPR